MSLSSGRQIGQYTKIKTIGKGSYGSVNLVREAGDSQLYVMKVVKNMSVGSGKHQIEALQEVKILESLTHPNIVSFKEAFLSQDKRELYIVMAYCDSGDLHARIEAAAQQRKLFSEDQILDWFVQLAVALEYLHSKKILHRDLKPQNVFLTNSNKVVKLGDFGITKTLEDTGAMAVTKIGTPYYFSPELCRNRPYNYKSDVWALGALTYEMATLRVPFDANDMPQLVNNILNTKPPAPSRQYSGDFRNMLGAMLAKSPDRRPTVAQLLALPLIRDRVSALVARYEALPSQVGGPGADQLQVVSTKEETATGHRVVNSVEPATAAQGGEGGTDAAAAAPSGFAAELARLRAAQGELESRISRKRNQLKSAAAPAPAEVSGDGAINAADMKAFIMQRSQGGAQQEAVAPGEASSAAVTAVYGSGEARGLEEMEAEMVAVCEQMHSLSVENNAPNELKQMAELLRDSLASTSTVQPLAVDPDHVDEDGITANNDGFKKAQAAAAAAAAAAEGAAAAAEGQ